MNVGKQFEADWKRSIPTKTAWYYRLRDSGATYYGGGDNLRFSVDNLCDCIVYKYPCIYLFELKTCDTPSIPLQNILGAYDKDADRYRKAKHLIEMADAETFKGVGAFVVIYFRGNVNRTFAVSADKIYKLVYHSDFNRKSIPWQWCEENGVEVGMKLRRVHYDYDVEGLLNALKKSDDVMKRID